MPYATSWREIPYTRYLGKFGLVLCVLFVLGIKFDLDSKLNINWDEFNYLSKIFQNHRNELGLRLQTLHIHIFAWLPWVSRSGVDQILAARNFLFVLRIGSCICIFLLGRRLLGVTGGLFAALASICFSFDLYHAESFRYDPILSFCFLLASCLFILRPHSHRATLGAGIVLGVSSLISIKTVLFGPALAVILAARADSQSTFREVVRALIPAVLGFAVTVALLYGLQILTVSPHLTIDQSSVVTQAGGKMFLSGRYVQAEYLIETLRYDYYYWALLWLGLLLAFADAVHLSAKAGRDALITVAFSLPLLWLIFYRNAFPYFYVSIMPAASLLCGVVASKAESRLSGRPLLAALAPLALAAPLLNTAIDFDTKHAHDEIGQQRAVIAAVHEIFPDPVPYIDRCSMIVGYPKVGPFMTTWMMEEYRNAEIPIMEEILREGQPHFLLHNTSGLNLVEPIASGRYRLLQHDHTVLRENFVRHWGPLWIPGKRFSLLNQTARKFEILIEGDYTVNQAVTIDGREHAKGSVLALKQGFHTIASRAKQSSGNVELRFGNQLGRPDWDPPKGKLFRGYRFDS